MIYLIKLNDNLADPKHDYPKYEHMYSFPNGYMMGEYEGNITGYSYNIIEDPELIIGAEIFHIPNGKKLPYNPFTGEMAPNRDKENRLEIVYSEEQIKAKSKFKKFIYKIYIDDITAIKLNSLKSTLFNNFEFDLFTKLNSELDNGVYSDLLKNEASSRGLTLEEFVSKVKNACADYDLESLRIFVEKNDLLAKLVTLDDDETNVSNFLIENNLVYR